MVRIQIAKFLLAKLVNNFREDENPYILKRQLKFATLLFEASL